MLTSVNPFHRLNREMKMFLWKLVSFIITWQVLYIFILKPHRIPDGIITKWLTICVTFTLNLFFQLNPAATWQPEAMKDSCVIEQGVHPLLVIFDDCNGLDLFIIYLALIVLLPATWQRKVIFCLGGILAIFMGNILRCVSLYWVYVHYKGMFEFNHHYVFTIIMYLIIFCGWVLFTKKPLQHEVD